MTASSPLPPIRLRLLGTVPYTEALERMRAWALARHLARKAAGSPPASLADAGLGLSAEATGPVSRLWPAADLAPQLGDEIWLMQHPPVFTLGLNARTEHLHDAGDIPVVPTERGGQITYHGPGQIMAYLMLDLRARRLGIRVLVERVEAAIIDCLQRYGIEAIRQEGAPGIYVRQPALSARSGMARADAPASPDTAPAPSLTNDPHQPGTAAPEAHLRNAPHPTTANATPAVSVPPAHRPAHSPGIPGADVAKIASIGLKTSQGFSYHGLALNARMDLSPFLRINPCGFRNLQMTDVWRESGQPAELDLEALALELGAALQRALA